MKKYLIPILFLCALLLSGPAIAGNPWTGSAVITIATDNTTSAAVSLPRNVSRIALQVPTLDSAAVSLKVSVDGTTYQDLYCFSNGTNTVKWATAASTGAYNVEVPCELYLWKYLKVVTGAGQTANRTITIYGIDHPPVAVR